MSAAHHQPDALAPPAALPRIPGWRDRVRAVLARRRGVQVGDRVALGRGVRFALGPGARVTLGPGAVIGDRCRFQVAADGEVLIGAGTVLGERCVISARRRVAVGARCLLADEVVLVDAGPRYDDVERPLREQGIVTSPIVVGDGARIGPAAALLPGATLPAGAVLGARAVLTRPSPPPSPPPARRARAARAPR